MGSSSEAAAQPLSGVHVVELGSMAAAAACGAQLASWGAAVVKVEPPSGERGRDSGAAAKALPGGRRVNPRFELHNRGKRSLALDLAKPRAQEVLDALLERSDVFVTNALPRVLERFGLAWDDVHPRHPHLVYGHITGYGRGTPDENRASYDHGAFWAQSGLAAAFSSPTGDPPPPSGGLGDRAAGLALAGAVCAARLGREREAASGRGSEHRGALVATSLLRTGLWLQGSVVSDALATGRAPKPDRYESGMPTLNWFRCADGRLLMLEVMDPEHEWGRLAAALDDEAITPEGFGRGSRRELQAASAEVVRQMERIFARRPLEEWVRRLDSAGIRFEPVVDHAEVVSAGRARAAGAFLPSRHPDVPEALADPCTLGTDPPVAPRAPSVGEHTAAVLSELGLSGEERESLVESGAAYSPESEALTGG